MKTQNLVKEICPTTTQKWVKEGALLVDVREKEEVDLLAFNVPNIVNIPLSEFEDRFQELPKNQKMVMVCKSGGRSLRAAGFLINHEYNPNLVVNMQHGIVRWVQKGFPVKGNTASIMNNEQASGCCDTSNDFTQGDSGCCNSNANNNC
ncbi:rhodanese-like domain-containing protein [Hydrotalea sp.]|uniref:rhodanese-like domain-containing protein n=1 Tax=Hydrotalea sp. TaxID=2881279 RepID=UPI003D0A12A9